jgi:hypothetical protein
MNGVFSGLAFAPVLPPAFLVVLAVLAVAAAGVALVRRARGAGLRVVVLALLLLALANPRLVEENRTLLPDVALVVVDDSQSQDIGDRRAQTAQALAALRDRLGRQPNLDVRVEHVANTPGRDEGTRLFTAMEGALAEVPRRRLAGIVIISDGRVHDVPADLGRSLGVPIHTLLTGHPGEHDRRLVVDKGPGFGLVGKTVTLKLRVDDPGGGGEAAVAVRIDGQPYAGLKVPLNRDATLEVPIRHGGQNVVELEAEAGPAELSLANNRAALGITGVRDRLKVLLISGEPHAGERTWRNLLKADPAVDLVHFTILRPPEKDDRTPVRELALITFPVRELFEEKLNDFDLVIFDRYRRRGVLTAAYYRNLAQYVRQGGALLAAVGPEFGETGGGLYDTALADVLPAAPAGAQIAQEFVPTVTATGRRHPVTAGLPGGETDPPTWGHWMRQMAVQDVRGTTLLSGAEGRPLVVVDRVGEGRVAEVLSDTIWLWARGYEGGGPHGELLRRLAHWLMKEPELEEEALTAEVKAGQLEVARRSLAAAVDSVTVTRPDGSQTALGLTDQGDGRAIGRMAADQTGLYRVAEGALTAIAAAGSPDPLELAELTATAERLGPVAAATGGGIAWLSEGGVPDIRRVSPGRLAAGRGWFGLDERGDHVVTGLRQVPLLPAILLLIVGLGGLLAAWRREGK